MKQNEADEMALSLLGVDTGGTFTDFVYYHNGIIQVHKVLSTPDAPERAILQGIADLGCPLQGLHIVHGSTVATNAVLQRRGVRTVYIGNRGLKDLLSIGRQARRSLYDLQPPLVPPPVPEEMCLETGGRLSASGELLEVLTGDDIQTLLQQLSLLKPQSIAINLLYSYLDASLEQRLAESLPDEYFVSCSSEVLPEYREYERGMATWLNAYVGPLMQGYLSRLESDVAPAGLSVMQSSAGTLSASQAGRLAVNLLLSGPAGGLMAAHYIGKQTGHEQLLTLDMGGTSTDVALIDGHIRLTSEGFIGDYPVAVPMVDMHTIGAGGGSIAYLDAGGLLHVGPESAGASPGPACYARGGKQPTVTDANLLLGRIPADSFLGGRMPLDVEAAKKAISTLSVAMGCSLEQAAEGIIKVANEHMVQALRVISVQRGCDPRGYTLVSFGGAGGLHVCSLADALQITRVIVPVHAGVLSALGMLVTPRQRQHSQAMIMDIHDVNMEMLLQSYQSLIARGMHEMHQEGVKAADISVKCSMDLRYRGQSYSLNVDFDLAAPDIDVCQQHFNQQHRRLYGHSMPEPVELVNIRVAVSGPCEEMQLASCHTLDLVTDKQAMLYGVQTPARIVQRDALLPGQILSGPALILEAVASTYIAPGWSCCRDESGHLLLTLK